MEFCFTTSVKEFSWQMELENHLNILKHYLYSNTRNFLENEMLRIIDDKSKKRMVSRRSFVHFVNTMWPFLHNWVSRIGPI